MRRTLITTVLGSFVALKHRLLLSLEANPAPRRSVRRPQPQAQPDLHLSSSSVARSGNRRQHHTVQRDQHAAVEDNSCRRSRWTRTPEVVRR